MTLQLTADPFNGWTLEAVVDAGDDVLIATLVDPGGTTHTVRGWVSATQRFYPGVAIGDPLPDPPPQLRAMTADEVTAYVLGLATDQLITHPLVAATAPDPTPIAFAAPPQGGT